MSTIEQIEARVAHARYRFFKGHRDLAPNEANFQLVEEWCDANLKSLEDSSAWESAFEALGKGSFAENRQNVVVERPRAETPAPAPEPILTEQELLRKLKSEMYSENPAVAFEAEDQLKRIATGPQNEGQSDKDYFALLYAPSNLRRMTEAKLKLVRHKYGAALVSFTINRSE
jgi:hypothetical protein